MMDDSQQYLSSFHIQIEPEKKMFQSEKSNNLQKEGIDSH